MIRVLLVDDQKTVREKLKASLESEADIEIVGTASDGVSAIEQVERLLPDVVIMNMEMPSLDGASATKQITNRFIETKVIIHTSYDSDEYIVKSLAMGAKGYLLKSLDHQDLAIAIRNINKGYTQISPGLLDKLLVYTDSGVILSKLKSLSSRSKNTVIEQVASKPAKNFSNLQLACRQQQQEIVKLRQSLDTSQQELPKIQTSISNFGKRIWFTLMLSILSLSIFGLFLYQLYQKTNNLQLGVIPEERVGLYGEFNLNGIAQRVSKAFEQDSVLKDVSTIYVAQEDDAVVLTGTVSDAAILKRMKNIALEVTGVEKVFTSQVTITPSLSENVLNLPKSNPTKLDLQGQRSLK